MKRKPVMTGKPFLVKPTPQMRKDLERLAKLNNLQFSCFVKYVLNEYIKADREKSQVK